MLMASELTPLNDAHMMLYFGYGSDLWMSQMAQRCPNSVYVGIARLRGYKWMINERGYADVVHNPHVSSIEAETSSHVRGLVYRLTADDERRLDINEAVPSAYEKRMHTVDFWHSDEASPSADPQISSINSVNDEDYLTKITALIYIDQSRVAESEPQDEYIVRMNKGIEDAVRIGVPEYYVRKVSRKFIPASEGPEDARQLAEQQERHFQDEREDAA